MVIVIPKVTTKETTLKYTLKQTRKESKQYTRKKNESQKGSKGSNEEQKVWYIEDKAKWQKPFLISKYFKHEGIKLYN